MNKTEQGVLQQRKLVRWLLHILLPLIFVLAPPAFSETLSGNTPTRNTEAKKHQVLVVYSSESTMHIDIIEKLISDLNKTHDDIVVSKITADEKTPEKLKNTAEQNYDLIVTIGRTGMLRAEINYPNIQKLFISTDPNKYQLDPVKNKNDAILYMTQSYCRQLHFVELLNSHWKTISILHSQEKPVDKPKLRQCANSLDIKLYIVTTSANENLTNKIKRALGHCDVLLALPDSNVYNRKTVKNILLTSYRHRKPVIAFSKNFVNAGALASISSNTAQIAQSAVILIEQFFDSGERFTKVINHPADFDISINRQVFRALDQIVPDTDELKRSMLNDSGRSQ